MCSLFLFFGLTLAQAPPPAAAPDEGPASIEASPDGEQSAPNEGASAPAESADGSDAEAPVSAPSPAQPTGGEGTAEAEGSESPALTRATVADRSEDPPGAVGPGVESVTERAELSGGEEKKDKKDKKDKKVRVNVRARVIAGARIKHSEPGVDSMGGDIGADARKASFELRQARARIDARYLDILRVRISADFADLLDSPESGDVIRDGWLNVRVHKAFQIKAGQFKRPYSRLELRGVWSVPVVGRGLYNGFAIEKLSWGDRAVGAQLWGRIKPKRRGLHALSWALSASNDALSGAPNGVDTHARLTYDPIKVLSIGVSGAFKHVQDPLADEPACLDSWSRDPGCRRDVFGAGGDIAVQVGGFYGSAEVNVAQDWSYAETSPWVLGALVYASYDFEVAKRTRLQPMLFGEFTDTNLSLRESEAVRAVGALNILWSKHLRVMPQVQFVVPLQPVTAFNQFATSQTYGLWIGAQI